MTHKQHPLGTSFTPASTADDVLAGIDLTGRNVIVTGGHAGIGLEVTRALAKAGASVTVGARDPNRAVAALAGLDGVEVGLRQRPTNGTWLAKRLARHDQQVGL